MHRTGRRTGAILSTRPLTALNARRGTSGEYAGHGRRAGRVPLTGNVVFCALAGVAWYLQFFFYSMSESRMGAQLKFSSKARHLAAIIVFSRL